jgi:hypothetical protein
MRVAGHASCNGEIRNAHNISVEEPTRNSPLRRLKGRLEDNIKMDIKEIGLDSACSVYGPASGSCGHGTDPSGSINVGEFFDQLSGYSFLKRLCCMKLVKLFEMTRTTLILF